MEKYGAKTYHIKTYGCQANMADSNYMAGVLEALGMEYSPDPLKSSVFIVNTCSVRQKSEDKAYGIGKAVKSNADKGRTKPFIVLAGCMVGSATGERQRLEFEELKKKTPWVDQYINPSQLKELPNLLVSSGVLGEWARSKISSSDVLLKPETKEKAFVNISYGCDNFCTFCVVPYARGKEISRPKEEILREINHLVSHGVSEITLCGQNVNSWNLPTSKKFAIRTGSRHKLPFADLLREVHEVEGIKKIDFLSSNPFDFTTDLLETLKLPKISNYLHIALQSGDNAMLKKMNRRHSVEDFIKLIKLIREVKPEVELGTDIIIGFPSETEEQFLRTVEVVKLLKFNVAFISIYSPRKGTPAQKYYPDDIPLKEKKRRHAFLTQAWKDSLNE